MFTAAAVRRVFVLGASLALVVGCGATPTPAPSTPGSSYSDAPAASVTPSPSATAERHAGLSSRESADLAAELVPLVGYRYTDVSKSELASILKQVPKSITAASFHGVEDAATGTEIAFLQLNAHAPDDAMFSAAYGKRLAQSVLGASSPVPMTVSGQKVWYLEDPASPMSRNKYVWTRHGTLGVADGPDKAALERFLTAYFAAGFRGAEPALLSERMVDVAGFGYTNAIDRAKERTVAEAIFEGSTASLHYLFDTTHSIGGLMLAGPTASLTDDQLVARVGAWFTLAYGVPPKELSLGESRTYGAITVQRLEHTKSGMSLYLWQWPDTHVVGWVATSRPDLVEPFLADYMTAAPLT